MNAATGIGVSPGIAVGPGPHRGARGGARVPAARCRRRRSSAEVQRLTRAVEASRRQLQAIKERLSPRGGRPHAYIFDAHLLMLEDPLLLDRAVAVIRQEHVNAEWALRTRVRPAPRALRRVYATPTCASAATDLDDVLGPHPAQPRRRARTRPRCRACPGQFVIVAVGPHAVGGGRAGLGARAGRGHRRRLAPRHHTSILARSFGIPAVVGLQDATTRDPARGARWSWTAPTARWWSSPRSPPSTALRAVPGRTARGSAPAGGCARPALRDAGRRAPSRSCGNAEFPEEATPRRRVRGGGHRALPLGVPARPRAPVAGRRAAVRGLPPAARADRAPPGHGADLGRGPGGPRAPGARPAPTRPWGSARCACCAAPRSRSGRRSGPCCAPAATGRCGSCSRS